VILAKRLGRGVQMIAHDRAVQPAAQPRLVTRLGLAARLRLVLELTSMSIRSLSATCVVGKEVLATRAGILS
jgi:hypothetical protein